MNLCHFCHKEAPQYHNYCSWECHVNEAKANGGQTYLPNGLPVGCIRHDGNMYEHEHGDHPDYKFPVTIEFIGKKPEDLPEWDHSYSDETHALIYCDGWVAITMYEHCYAMWYLHRNEFGGGSLWGKKGEYRIKQESLDKIRERYPTHHD